MDNIGITDRAANTVHERLIVPTAVATAAAETTSVGNLKLPIQGPSSVCDQLSISPTDRSPRDGTLAPTDGEVGIPDEAGTQESIVGEDQVSRMAENREKKIKGDAQGTTAPSCVDVDTWAAGQGMREEHPVSSGEDFPGSDYLTEELPGTTTGRDDSNIISSVGVGAGGDDDLGLDRAKLASADRKM